MIDTNICQLDTIFCADYSVIIFTHQIHLIAH